MEDMGGALGEWWVYGLASLAGLASFRDVFDWSDTWKKTTLKLSSHLSTSAFAGLMAFHFAMATMGSLQVERNAKAAMLYLAVGIVAWRGAKGLQWIAEAWERRNGGQGGAK